MGVADQSRIHPLLDVSVAAAGFHRTRCHAAIRILRFGERVLRWKRVRAARLIDRHISADDAEYLHDARPRAQRMIILLDPGRLLNRLAAGLILVLPRIMTVALMAAKVWRGWNWPRLRNRSV